ncbi:uncharacterized protein LOC105701017 isoform X2 [Orussus abietinus]|uniref:uncharacterized protein LOC105701017 isoform X2 n=1 Tax=Orussus abietinus TaxID=222816 RepID=UPI000625CD25|nr:uncharacterized protein LOC105701017 isoform X2 [Orussus abietinus]
MNSGFLLLLVSVFCLTADEIEAQRSGWSLEPNTQYHIQTDEGPERYFRYQTLNGQYRKEKRLEDGTVIGTEGWLDPLGYLRIKDYIADREGFRILKSKTIYVGKDRPIQDAVAISKNAPAQSGVLARPQRPPNPFRQPEISDVASKNIVTSTATSRRRNPGRFAVPSPTTTSPLLEDGYSQPNTNYLGPGYRYQGPFRSYRRRPAPALVMQPPFLEDNRIQESRPIAKGGYPARRSPQTLQSDSSRRFQGLQEQGAFPSRRASVASRGQVRYQPPSTEYPAYDGAHSTADGFQYYLKTHYHEEEDKPEKKVGSFGYVDPFGIRRVVYYSADAQNGFQHRKNNKFVGFQAPPYDSLRTSSH